MVDVKGQAGNAVAGQRTVVGTVVRQLRKPVGRKHKQARGRGGHPFAVAAIHRNGRDVLAGEDRLNASVGLDEELLGLKVAARKGILWRVEHGETVGGSDPKLAVAVKAEGADAGAGEVAVAGSGTQTSGGGCAAHHPNRHDAGRARLNPKVAIFRRSDAPYRLTVEGAHGVALPGFGTRIVAVQRNIRQTVGHPQGTVVAPGEAAAADVVGARPVGRAQRRIADRPASVQAVGAELEYASAPRRRKPVGRIRRVGEHFKDVFCPVKVGRAAPCGTWVGLAVQATIEVERSPWTFDGSGEYGGSAKGIPADVKGFGAGGAAQAAVLRVAGVVKKTNSPGWIGHPPNRLAVLAVKSAREVAGHKPGIARKSTRKHRLDLAPGAEELHVKRTNYTPAARTRADALDLLTV